MIRERQKIFSIPNLDRPMQVVANVPEAIVDQIVPRLTVRVKVDAFADETLPGVVKTVAPLPNPPFLFDSNTKTYNTHIEITRHLPGLRPGMTAQVEILVAERDNVLSVPVDAVVTYDNKHHVAVKTADGVIDWREVTLGLSNGKMVEVKEGLKT